MFALSRSDEALAALLPCLPLLRVLSLERCSEAGDASLGAIAKHVSVHIWRDQPRPIGAWATGGRKQGRLAGRVLSAVVPACLPASWRCSLGRRFSTHTHITLRSLSHVPACLPACRHVCLRSCPWVTPLSLTQACSTSPASPRRAGRQQRMACLPLLPDSSAHLRCLPAFCSSCMEWLPHHCAHC